MANRQMISTSKRRACGRSVTRFSWLRNDYFARPLVLRPCHDHILAYEGDSEAVFLKAATPSIMPILLLKGHDAQPKRMR